MRKQNISHMFAVLVLAAVVVMMSVPAVAGPKCSGCHPSMAKEPMMLPEAPPADILLAVQNPCYNYARVLEEYYSVEELFVTIEHHLAALWEARYHTEPMAEELVASRNLFREVKKEPIVSLDDFVQKTGKLRFDVGKVYRTAKEHRIDQHNRSVFGFFVIGTLFILFLIVSGWRVASGKGEIHPARTKLGYDDLQEQGIEALLEQEAKDKEASE